ncbi:hypothetical protein H7A76_32085 [Pseudomonas sp. MSSRFD41]|uniref:hypothetical protein n=1 Tax=Pseudomonas sp. MSSRFD41 TaxID=1310370 RepID=UPI00163AF15D|nr:hypothetical protein [Pseudomonas sp. MSSRFD41]MBC2659789.1 hypothetical protein [Pseudomonas sp. MSSRFD41]MBC2660092.1 hypothetical protein [Pseudomonas sp. MSSRFD41]
MSVCPKCLGQEIVVAFVPANALINHSGRTKIETEFVTSSQYEFFWQHKAAKDHLKKHCRTCQFSWRQATADEVKP